MKRLFIALLLGVGITITFLGILKPVAYAQPLDSSLSVDILSYVPPQQAGTGTVRVALTGVDAPGCGSLASPCRTVQFAVDEAIPGDTVILSAGTWNESVTLSQPISLTGVSSATAIIQALPGQRVLTVTGAAIDNTVVISGLTFGGGDVSGGNICFSGDTTNCGGGILLTNDAQPTIQHVIIENNDAYRGGGLYANETGGLLLDHVIFRNNSTILNGGGLNAPNMPITVTNSLFQQNTTTHNVGGALATAANFAVVAPILISNTTFLSNTAQCLGGMFGICEAPGVYLFDQDTQIIDSHFEGNSCPASNCDGGGVSLTASFNDPSFSLVNTDFINNTVGGQGGGLYTTRPVQVTGGRFEGNSANGQQTAFSDGGGGMRVQDLILTGTEFIGNTSGEDGGAIHVRGDAVISDARLTANQAITNGAGIYVFLNLVMTNTEFFSNTAGMNGGGAYVDIGNVQVTGGRFEDNRANGPENDGGFLTTENGGGGLWAGNNLTMSGTEFNGNVAETNGGGAHVRGNAVLNGGRFEQNQSLGDLLLLSGYGGGGLYVIDTLTFTDTIFNGNQAALLGGGVWASQDVSGLNGLFQNNNAGRGGGGLFTLNDLTLTSSQVIANEADVVGGGVSVNGVATLSNALFQANRVISTALGASGGGLRATDGFTATNSQFIGNSATGTGGGASVFGPVNLGNSLFQNNVSDGSGGGLAGSFDPVTVNDSQFINNTATTNGGGILSNGQILLNNSLFQNNRTIVNNGGGLHTSGSVTLVDSQIIDNIAGANGGGIWANSGLNGTNGRIENNTSGDSGGGFYGGLAGLNVNGTVFANNQAGGNGGGAYAFDGTAVDNALFEENTATGVGGGLFLHRFVHINATRFLGNDANLGGGLAISRTNTGTAVQFVNNSLFARNTATTNGAGIYWNQPRPVDLIHNTIASPAATTGAAIHVVTGPVSITNNIIANHTTGIEVVGGTVTENYNLFSGNTANTSGAVGGGVGSLTGNPAFQNPASDDYHLTNASQAINLGIDAGITVDFDNDPRPGIGGFDAGYDETAYAPLLSVSKTATPATDAPYHGEIVYTVVISNSGELDATNTMLTDTLPVEVDFDRFIQSNGATVNSDEITWLGTVPINTSLTFSFVVSHTGDYEDVFTNTVEFGHATSSDSASTMVAVEAQVADLLISKSSVRDEGMGVITYTIVVQNLGPHDASGVTVSDPIPAGISAFNWQCTPSGSATCTANGTGNINDTLTSFPMGGQVIYTVQATMVSTDVTVVNTATLLLPPDLTNTAPTNSAINTSAPVGNIFLPIVMAGAGGSPPVGPPDLVIDSIVASSTRVTVTIRNTGTSPVVDAFWVDVYINPNTPPTGVNQRWEDLGSQGMVWGVVGAGLTSLTPGGTLTLTNDGSDPYYRPEYSQFSTPLVAPIYVQADSVNFATNYGNVLESNEGNNIDSTSIIITGLAETPSPHNAAPSLSASSAGLPSRQQ